MLRLNGKALSRNQVRCILLRMEVRQMIRLAFLLSIVVCVYGCRQRDIPEKLERDILSLPSRISKGNSEPFCNYLYERISVQTNRTIRFACYALLWREMNRALAFALSG